MKYSWFKSNTFHPNYRSDKSGYILILGSHTANIIPITLGILLKLPLWYILIMVAQMIFSFLYHAYSKNNWLRLIDWLLATSLIISNAIIFFSHNWSYSKLLIIVLLIIISFKYFLSFKKYAYNHSIWHICAAAITSIVEL